MYGWGVRGEGDWRQCKGCKRWVSRANYARHVRTCGSVDVGGAIRREGQTRMVTCGGCGREMRAGKPGQASEGGVPSVGPGRGGGQTPDGGRRTVVWMDG